MPYGGVGSTGDETLGHSPLEYLYQKFSAYIEERRREPRADALTEMANALRSLANACTDMAASQVKLGVPVERALSEASRR